MTDDHLRMSDADREEAATELGEHFAQGRLTADEYAERLDRVWAARTRGELAPLFRDLPGRYGPPAPARESSARRSTSWSGGMSPWRRGVPTPLVVVLVVLLVLTVVTHLPVILVGLAVVWFVLSRHRGRSRAPHWSRSPR
ncbi:DUF1707 domain-containing protein [Nocardioides sp. CN2-186]|uniref:DUF1707 SHOCT-like domain-containing protein n=1 Tax=Nocardioides tweenelious TaxID=3156607 RepID=UPI0032B5BEA0